MRTFEITIYRDNDISKRIDREQLGKMGMDGNGWEPCGQMAMRAGSSNGIAAYRTDVEGEGGTKKPSLGQVSFGWFYFLR